MDQGVDIGFAENCEHWMVQSHSFPSKVGGKPAWLNYGDLPSAEELQCPSCCKQMVFVCQIYAPYEEDPANFHRTVFLFVCRSPNCSQANVNSNFVVLRSSLPRCNDFYPFDPPNYDEKSEFDCKTMLCSVCGCNAKKFCSKCKTVSYCTREHQVLDWKAGHKENCTSTTAATDALLYPEFELVIEAEDKGGDTVEVSEVDQLDQFKRMEEAGETGTLVDVPETDLQAACIWEDKVFSRFQKRVARNKEEVVRYERGGVPLWIAAKPTPDAIPPCQYCSGARHFEFQVMPQLLSVIGENDVDWGVIAVYTCERSCSDDVKPNYKREYAFKQDISSE